MCVVLIAGKLLFIHSSMNCEPHSSLAIWPSTTNDSLSPFACASRTYSAVSGSENGSSSIFWKRAGIDNSGSLLVRQLNRTRTLPGSCSSDIRACAKLGSGGCFERAASGKSFVPIARTRECRAGCANSGLGCSRAAVVSRDGRRRVNRVWRKVVAQFDLPCSMRESEGEVIADILAAIQKCCQ